jgi:hypothetical protein
MTTVLTEFTNEAINSDIELSYIKKFNTELQPLLALAPKMISNSYGYGLKMNLSGTDYIACYGDNFFTNIRTYLNQLLNPLITFNDYTINGARSNDIIKDILLSRNIITNQTLANRQSILFFGLNDIATTDAFYNSSYGYGQNLLSLFLPLLIPYNNIVKASDITTKNGTWAAANAVSPFSLYTIVTSNYLEHTFTNCRYVAISWVDFRFDVADKTLFNVYINTVLASTLNKDIVLETSASGIITCAMVIDTGLVQNITVKVVAGNSDVLVINYFAAWNDTHISDVVNKKKLLICYNNLLFHSISLINTAPVREHALLESLFCAVNSCKRVGLPISLICIPAINNAITNVPSASQNRNVAEFIINNGCYIP